MNNKIFKTIETIHSEYYAMLKKELNKSEDKMNYEKINLLKEMISALQEIYFAILRSE